MRFQELFEGKNIPCIVVDVQPAYLDINHHFLDELAVFLANQKAPILMFVNADETGMTDDNVEHDIFPFWEEIYDRNGLDFYSNQGLDKMIFTDKGYGYLRGWMDYEYITDRAIIKTIREMYKQKVNDSRMLFGGEDHPDYLENMTKLGLPFELIETGDSISVEWTSIAQLKKFNGCYIMGGGRHECLREVELLMNAFNIKYKRLERFVYG